MDRKKRLTPFAASLFPAPTMYQPKPRENHNFTEDALHQMTPYKKANAIAALCDNLVHKTHGITKYNMIDACAGIGGNTMAFALNPSVNTVHACECDADTFAMLSRNVNNLRHGNTVTTTHACFNTSLLQQLAADSALPTGLFIDPPWGLQRPYLDLFHRPLALTNEVDATVCAWLRAALREPNILFVIIKVPKDYPWNGADTPEGARMHRVASIAKMDMLCFTKETINA
jgi:predicted RNA methylase